MGRRTLVEFENGTRTPRDRVLRDLKEMFEAEGVVFIDADGTAGPGVRLRTSEPGG